MTTATCDGIDCDVPVPEDSSDDGNTWIHMAADPMMLGMDVPSRPRNFHSRECMGKWIDEHAPKVVPYDIYPDR